MTSRQLFLLYDAEVCTGHGIWRIWANFFLLVIELAIKGHKSERGRTLEEKEGQVQDFKECEHLIDKYSQMQRNICIEIELILIPGEIVSFWVQKLNMKG